MWGGKVSELDGTPSSSGYDELNSRSEANYITKFFPIDSSYAGEPLSFPLSDKLQEGYYEVGRADCLRARGHTGERRCPG
jgi:hypothetical protein